MAEITTLTNEYIQNFSYTLPENGNVVECMLFFDANLSKWFLNINYNDGEFILNGKRIDTSFNLLAEYVNIIPFGIMVITTNTIAPFRVESWIAGDAQFYIESIDYINELKQDLING